MHDRLDAVGLLPQAPLGGGLVRVGRHRLALGGAAAETAPGTAAAGQAGPPVA